MPQIQDGHHIILLNLKKRKLAITISLLKLKDIFPAEPMQSRTYLDNQYFIILSLST